MELISLDKKKGCQKQPFFIEKEGKFHLIDQ